MSVPTFRLGEAKREALIARDVDDYREAYLVALRAGLSSPSYEARRFVTNLREYEEEARGRYPPMEILG